MLRGPVGIPPEGTGVRRAVRGLKASVWCGSQVVRQRFAKPSYVGSNPIRTSENPRKGVSAISPAAKGTFRSLKGFNYRMWAGGAVVSNVGTWMQRTAQDWLVLTQLTHDNATAVGVVMSLQFGPQVL
jgi:hypothetical protein